MLILSFIPNEGKLLSARVQRGAGGEAAVKCMWLLALQAGVSVTDTAHTAGAASQ